jgi:aminopeptidase YwaD
VTRSPWSIATATDDVEEVFGRYVIDGAFRAAGDGDMAHAVRSPGGSKDALWADITPYESGSDHWIYQEGGFRIPAIYLRDHPDIYIHTTGDVADNIEPTKIKRSAFIAAASGYYLATLPDRGAALLRLTYANALGRLAEDGVRAAATASGRPMEAANIVVQAVGREQRRLQTLPDLALPGAPIATDETLGVLADRLRATGTAIVQAMLGAEAPSPRSAAPDEARVPVRNPSVKGPLAPAGDWLTEKGGRGAAAIAITRVPRSDDVTYEIVNFVDGTRTVRQIRDAVSAEFEPVDLAAVAEYLDLLARAGAVTFKR